jgi:quercetin dioxygenase-like cupin family protein
VWLANGADTEGAFLLFETTMDAGKATPLHTHPADEALVVVEGEILVHLDGAEHTIRPGGIAVASAGVPHAFLTLLGPPPFPADRAH